MNRFATIPLPSLPRTAFDLSYEKKMTADFFCLYPHFFEDCIPGDVFKLGVSHVCRFNPLIYPLMHEISIYFHYFFVPYRIIDHDFEEIYTGGISGTSSKVPPVWPHFSDDDIARMTTYITPYYPGAGAGWSAIAPRLWDYFGLPCDIDFTAYNADTIPIKPFDYPRRAYYCILSQYFMDEDYPYNDNFLDAAGRFNLTAFLPGGIFANMQAIFPRYWRKDYFTTARPWPERGVAPAFPIGGNYPITWIQGSPGQTGDRSVNLQGFVQPNNPGAGMVSVGVESTMAGQNSSPLKNLSSVGAGTAVPGNVAGALGFTAMQVQGAMSALPANLRPYVTLSGGSFDVSDLRSTVQMQKWLERNARGGARFTEFLRNHFIVHPTDERLDRPEFIGSARSFLTISEVLQTSASQSGSTPQANMAGHGIGISGQRIGTYRVQEPGCIIGLCSIMPRPAYEDRLDRRFIKRNRFDFPFPEFAHLSEQGIFAAELRYNGLISDQNVIGFQPVYEWCRSRQDEVSGLFRQSYTQNLSRWHIARHFAAGSVATINNAFLLPYLDFRPPGQAGVEGLKRGFAVPSQPSFLLNIRNHVTAIRPLPFDGTPGYVDHY